MLQVQNQEVTNRYAIYNGDSCEILKGIPSDSIHYSIFSPPFEALYTYSDSTRDLGNSKSYDEFFKHFSFIAEELVRIIKPGRLISIHCMDIPAMKERDGYIGLKEFPGDIIRMFQRYGMIYHSRVTIWKDPLVEATRTKAIGLMHKQLCKDSAVCRNGLPDYLVTMRKPGENDTPVTHEQGMTEFIGENPPNGAVMSHEIWRRYASPVWADIRQNDTLQYTLAREANDERHICPLQLDVIRRGIELWSNKGETVITPFMGIGSEVYCALEMHRRGVGIELKESYYKQAALNCQSVTDTQQTSLLEEI